MLALSNISIIVYLDLTKHYQATYFVSCPISYFPVCFVVVFELYTDKNYIFNMYLKRLINHSFLLEALLFVRSRL
jgi:hypothetical protein